MKKSSVEGEIRDRQQGASFSPESRSSPKNNRVLHGSCTDVSHKYRKVGNGRIGEGTYGVVYKAEEKRTTKSVALKKCYAHHEASDGFPVTTLREIHALRMSASHPNVVDLLEVSVSSSGSVFLVFEHCDSDLAKILDDHYHKKASPFSMSTTQSISRQLLEALDFCHSHGLVHRDIKPSNLLYNASQQQLKLCDFGLSRTCQEIMTPNVVSLWYRAPELLFRTKQSGYSFPIDLWAVGCVVAELLKGVPFLDGTTEVDQIHLIVGALGLPPKRLYDYSGPSARPSLWDRFDQWSSHKGLLPFLTKLLEYDPKERWTAAQALVSEFVKVEPS